jgi:hypothetical protein
LANRDRHFGLGIVKPINVAVKVKLNSAKTVKTAFTTTSENIWPDNTTQCCLTVFENGENIHEVEAKVRLS